MAELSFSAIGDDVESVAEITRLLKEFQEASNTQVNVVRLPWDRAWQTLLMTAIEGKGGDVSQIGSTWASTLASLDSLRPISEAEVSSLGGANVFAPAAWQTVRVEGRGEVLAIPWSLYTFVVFYRRDLLEKAGLGEDSAFSTPEAMHGTFTALQNSGIPPWVIPTKQRYLDMPHIVSSWARAYGGELISSDGREVLFNTFQARKGVIQFFELYRFIPLLLHGLDYDACMQEFFQKGRTAVLIAGAEAYSDAVASNMISQDVRCHVGVAPVPGVPWIGGDHLVIWKTVRADLEKERAVVDLVRSLTSVENQVRLSRETTILPARLDAYPQLEFQPEGMRAVLEKVLETARPHPPMRLWRRIESMLVDMLGDIARSVLQSPEHEAAEIVQNKLAYYEQQFLLILGR